MSIGMQRARDMAAQLKEHSGKSSKKSKRDVIVADSGTVQPEIEALDANPPVAARHKKEKKDKTTETDTPPHGSETADVHMEARSNSEMSETPIPEPLAPEPAPESTAKPDMVHESAPKQVVSASEQEDATKATPKSKVPNDKNDGAEAGAKSVAHSESEPEAKSKKERARKEKELEQLLAQISKMEGEDCEHGDLDAQIEELTRQRTSRNKRLTELKKLRAKKTELMQDLE